MAEDQLGNGSLPLTSKTLYREDVVRHATRREKIGIVLVNGKDSDASSDSEDEEEKVEEGHVLVSWYPKGHEEEIEENMLEVVDRSLQHGDIVRWADSSKGGMKGTVTKINVRANIRVVGARHLLVRNVDCSELAPLQKFYQGLSVACRSWIGVVHDVLLKLTLKLKNGARCVIEGEQVNMLTDNTDQRDEDSSFYCELFYPGQSVAGPSRLFRDAQWINGPRPVLTGNQRLCCVVEEISVSGLNVRWRTKVFSTEEDILVMPQPILTQQDMERLCAFDHFNQESIQIGDKAFYTLKESDVSNPTSKRLTDEQSSGLKEQPDQKKSKQSGKYRDVPVDGDDEKLDENDSTDTDESGDDDDSDHGNVREARQATTANAGSRRNDSRHQGATAAARGHSARKRRQIRRKKKRYQVPVRLSPGERVCVEIDSTSKLLTVVWQDGSEQENISSTEVLPVLHVDDLEFFPGDFVVDKTVAAHTSEYAVVLKSDHAQRTCEVKWIDKEENEGSESVSVYDIGPHPNFNFKMGDIVGRLIDVNSSEMQEPENNHTGRFCGQVLRVDNEGKVHVLWMDGTTSTTLPQNTFVVENEDWSSSDPMNSSSDEEWETLSDVSTDPELILDHVAQPLNLRILDDIGRRSVAALANGTFGIGEDLGEGASANTNGDAEEDPADRVIPEENLDSTSSNLDNDRNASVKFRPNPTEDKDSEMHSTFSVSEAVPSSHKFANQPFQAGNQRQFNSAIRKEIAGLKSHLPPGVMVKGFENRLDLYSILIEGPADTPYEDGVFIFDVKLPPNYPKSPPVVRYLSQCTERLNPNLYEDGTVCVSLLGTWSGKGSETWTSKSNLCQLILSLQGLILVEEPYFNEAGYEKHKGSAEGAENSRMYNELVLIKMLQSLERLWKNPPHSFREEVKRYLQDHLPKLIHRIYTWLGQYAPSDFLEKHNIKKVVGEEKIGKPEYPLLPLSVGFCISLLRNLKSLEKTFGSQRL